MNRCSSNVQNEKSCVKKSKGGVGGETKKRDPESPVLVKYARVKGHSAKSLYIHFDCITMKDFTAQESRPESKHLIFRHLSLPGDCVTK